MRWTSKDSWLVALTIGVLGGVGFGVANARGVLLPRHAEYAVAVLSLIGGLAFGIKAVWLPMATQAAFGVTSLLVQSISPSQGEDQRAVVLLVAILLALVLSVPALIGAALRRLFVR